MKKALLIFFAVLISVALAQNSCQSRLFTLKSAPGVKIKEYVDNLADECGFTVIVKDYEASRILNKRMGKVVLNRASLYDLLHIILEENDLSYELNNNILKISYLITKTFHVDYVTSKRTGEATTDASVDLGGTSLNGKTQKETRDVNLITSKEEFDFWKNLQEEIYSIVNRPGDPYKAPKPVINEEAGLVTVTATKEQIERVQRYIDLMESRLHKEVLIDVSILAVFFNDQFTSGIDWSRFGIAINGTQSDSGNFIPGSPMFTYEGRGKLSDYTNSLTTVINASFNISGLINFLEQNGKVVTLSNPKILTLNNQPAIITIGDTLNYNVPTSITISANNNGLGEKSYTPSSIFVGILLNITPEITEDENIILRINPSISELRNPDEDQIGASGFREIAPDTKEKKISTVVKVKDGSTLILGGLISNTKNFTINGVPLLKDVPLFGHLFGSKRRENQRFELIFVIRPHIIKEADQNIGLKDLGFKDLVGYE